MCPGRVENWTIITDLNNLAVYKLQIKFLIRFLQTMQKHLKCRGRAFIALKVTFSIRMVWRTLSPFVDDRIKKKLSRFNHILIFVKYFWTLPKMK